MFLYSLLSLFFPITLSAYAPVAVNDTALTINEVMFYAPTGNTEFIELYNLSDTKSFDLAGYKLQYENTTPDIIRNAGKGTVLGPGKYAVILEGDYDSLNGMYNALIPQEALVLKINSNAFGSNGMANTSDRTIALLRPDNSVIEQYTYSSALHSAGISDEKILLTKSNAPNNWANSIATPGTPGCKNSVTPPQYDPAITSFTVQPQRATTGSTVRLQTQVKNLGGTTISNYLVKIYYDRNRDSIPAAGELIYQSGSVLLHYRDSTTLTNNFTLPDTIDHYFIAVLITPQDDNPANNTAYTRVLVNSIMPNRSSIIINEIMYAPANNEPEWIELYNKGNAAVSLHKFRISDRSSSVTITAGTVLQPGAYLVVAKDSSIRNYYQYSFPFITASLPVLNNDSDLIVLRDSLGNNSDSVNYHSGWGGGSGFSLERIYKDSSSLQQHNWGTCTLPHRASPGSSNALSPKLYDIAVAPLQDIPAYAVVQSQFTITAIIQNRGSLPSGTITLRLLQDYNNDGIPQMSETISWNDYQPLSAGASSQHILNIAAGSAGVKRFFVLAATDTDENTYNNLEQCTIPVIQFTFNRGDLVINELMPAPLSGSAEWVELYNRSGNPINLRSMKIADAVDTVTLTGTSLVLADSHYIIISRDSLLARQFPSITLCTAQLPVLNDAGDKIILLDSLNRVIDSIMYSSSWLGARGYSLEKIESGGSPLDSANWHLAVHPQHCTPGTYNSVSKLAVDAALLAVSGLPAYLYSGRQMPITVLVKNEGSQPIDSLQAELYLDGNRDSIPQPEELLTRKTLALPAGAIHGVELTISANQTGAAHYIASVRCSGDMKEYNNTQWFSLPVIDTASVRNTLVINEIMAVPLSGKSEWIEFYNTTASGWNLKGCRIADSKDTITITTECIVTPGGFAVLAHDNSFTAQYPGLQHILCPFPILNNDGDKIMLLDSLNRVIDSLQYHPSWLGQPGNSLERIEYTHSSTDSANWISGAATPGALNGATPKWYDAALTTVTNLPVTVIAGTTLLPEIMVQNKGRNSLQTLAVAVYNNISRDSLLHENDFITADTLHNLSVQEIRRTVLPLRFTIPGMYHLIFTVTCPEDSFTYNNTVFKSLTVVQGESLQDSIVINEIMCAPLTGNSEWIELYNRSSRELQLRGLRIADAHDTSTVSATAAVQPGAFLVIAREGSFVQQYPDVPFTLCPFPPLNNDGDKLMLLDSLNAVIDSLQYSPSWLGTQGTSLERVSVTRSASDSANWKPCAAAFHSSPGAPNHASRKSFDAALSSLASIPPSAAAGDTIRLQAVILNTGDSTIHYGEVNFTYQYSGALISRHNFSTPIQPGDSLTVLSSPVSMPDTSFQVKAKLTISGDEDSTNNGRFFTCRPYFGQSTIIISEIMCSPESGQPEWIELYNTTNAYLDLQGWAVSDALPSPRKALVADHIYLAPQSFLVLSNTANANGFPVIPFGTLNNSEDAITIANPSGITIDSLHYHQNWRMKAGHSLEKITLTGGSNAANWHFSLAPGHATPGAANSAALLTTSNTASLRISEIQYNPPVNGSEYIEIYNSGNLPAQVGGSYIQSGNSSIILCDTIHFLPADSYFTFLADTLCYAEFPALASDPHAVTAGETGFSLNNSGGSIALYGYDANSIDSVVYAPSFHTIAKPEVHHRSLERIDYTTSATGRGNWCSSPAAAGGSPGKRNAIAELQAGISPGFTMKPNPFSPDNDGFEDNVEFRFSLPYTLCSVSIKIFDDKGRLRRTISSTSLLPGTSVISFDGRDDSGRFLPLGMYIVLAEFTESGSNQRKVFKQVLVSARKL